MYCMIIDSLFFFLQNISRILERKKRLLAEISEVRRTRAMQRSARKRRESLPGQDLPTVAIVGYTNAVGWWVPFWPFVILHLVLH